MKHTVSLSYSIIPSCGIQPRRAACFEHSNFFKVNAPGPGLTGYPVKGIRWAGSRTGGGSPHGGPPAHSRDPTMSFLTAATLIYAIGAGITAAAGTRLALQWVLSHGFRIRSFQLQGLERDLYCYFLPLPLRVGNG